VRAVLIALAIVLAGAAIVVIGYFYRAPVPDGYALPRHNWWGGGPAGLYAGSLVDRNGCIGTDDGETIVWPARYSLAIVDGRPMVNGDGRWATPGDEVRLGGGWYDTAEVLASVTGEKTDCPAPYFITTSFVGEVAHPSAEIHQIGVSIIGLEGEGWPEAALTLEIGDQAWTLEPGNGDGVAWPRESSEQPVRLVRSADCHVLASFTAPLDTRWQVRVTSETEAVVSQVTEGVAFPWGPGLGETSPSGCP